MIEAVEADEAQLAPYRAELDLLAQRIKEEHPSPFRVISESEFDSLVSKAKADLRPEHAKRDTLWAMSEIIGSIGCGHSKLFYFVAEDQLINPEDRFPVDVRYVDGSLYVFDPLANAGRVSVGDEIRFINGRDVDEIMDEVYRHISGDANFPFAKRHLFNVSATSYLTYALDFPESYSLTLEGQTKPISLKALESFRHAPIISPKQPCQDNLCYRVDETTNAGLLTLRSFAYYGDSGAEFAEFINTSFDDLIDNQRDALIIDIRDNQGGSGLAGAYVLRRIADMPFTYFTQESDPRAAEGLFDLQLPADMTFERPTYVLANGHTFSSVPHFAAVAKANDFAVLVGETLGGNHATFDGKLRFASDLTGAEYFVARMPFVVEAGDADPMDPLRPDIAIPYTVEETLSREDRMLETLLDKIASGELPG